MLSLFKLNSVLKFDLTKLPYPLYLLSYGKLCMDYVSGGSSGPASLPCPP